MVHIMQSLATGATSAYKRQALSHTLAMPCQPATTLAITVKALAIDCKLYLLAACSAGILP